MDSEEYLHAFNDSTTLYLEVLLIGANHLQAGKTNRQVERRRNYTPARRKRWSVTSNTISSVNVCHIKVSPRGEK